MGSVSDRYDLKNKLGSGGFGDVYRALRKADGETVAIKLLRDHGIADCRCRFEREIHMLLEYLHPGIVKVLDFDLHADVPYYVMPFFKNGSLKDRVGKLSPSEVLVLVQSVISVLIFLEERGAFHRDIKPENVLLSDDGRAIVCDFGLGNDPGVTSNFTRHGAGTIGYAAPELSRRRDGASPKCDIYSLGATIFHLITGVHPGDAESLDLADYLDVFPEEIRVKILEMVAPEPSHRPGAKELLAWAAKLATDAWQPVKKKIKRAQRAVAGSGSSAPPPWLWPLIIILLVVAAAGTAIYFATRPPKSKPKSKSQNGKPGGLQPPPA